MRFEAFEEIFRNLSTVQLPGQEAQSCMAPPFREVLIEQFKKQGKKAKKAAVLALFYPNDQNQPMVVFIIRSNNGGVHSGQIAFPGGKPEPSDAGLWQTACREAQEEIGVLETNIKYVLPLTPLFIPPSQTDVFPFLGLCKERPIFQLQPTEVDSIVEVSLIDILNEKNRISREVKTSYGVKVKVPAFHFNGHIIWGATAMILMEIVVLFQKILKK